LIDETKTLPKFRGTGNLIYAGYDSLEHVISLSPTSPPPYLLNVVATAPSPDADYMHDGYKSAKGQRLD
jgi:hypothetical protein